MKLQEIYYYKDKMIDSMTYTARIGLFQCMKTRPKKIIDKGFFISHLVSLILDCVTLINIYMWTILILNIALSYLGLIIIDSPICCSLSGGMCDIVELHLNNIINVKPYEGEESEIQSIGQGFCLCMEVNKYMK